ncbi:MAG: PQQ-binding-like beta-propeller repeat protein [Actinobacteria bacterium]|nr:PQQ-binding-like beta-propeller repeat protein [Actinomycetota bacterium]MCG2818918.1 DUF5719 family protein [Actinomycetes bacterium]MBU4217436.1 PQQ-binding-like beta-propeller repeat protein [Actinomycetota bacterium]MBU4357754.1 PQQ-binding-like beta-propeller repeat protein [Actinomycetota bacterium]MBU4390975.1 PQQ-binding-like beta-propeller repeat protein [Actinomycetota bacterium]
MKKALVILLAAVMVVLMAAGAAAQEADEWSQFQKDAGNTGYIDVTVPDSGNVMKKTGAIDAVDGSQPVVSGNRFYVYTFDGTDSALKCYDLTTSKMVWEQGIDGALFGSWSSPVVSGGVAYVGSGSKVYAFKAEDGTALWTKDLATLVAGASIVNSSPTVVGNSLFIGDWQNGIYYCLDTANKGEKVWSFNLDASCIAPCTPAVDGNKVFVGQSAAFGAPVSPNGKVWCLNKSNGKPITTWGTNGYLETVNKMDVTGSVTVAGDYIYLTDFKFGAVAAPDSNLYCLEKDTGNEAWKADVYASSGTPVVGDGVVVTCGEQGAAWPTPGTNWTAAFAAEPGSGGAATQLWTMKDAGGFNMSASIAGGKALVGNWDSATWTNQGVWCLDLDNGDTDWKNETEGGSPLVPTSKGLISIGQGGVVTIGEGSSPDGDFYFAEGTTRDGYQEWICLENPGVTQIDANIQYMLTDGSVRDQAVALPTDSRTTIDVNLFLGPGVDASVHVTGNGYFVAERSMYVDTGTVSGGEQVMGVTGPAESILFAEGTTRSGYRTWLALQNPGDTDANVLITYVYPDKPPKAQNLAVKATSRETVDVNLNAGEGEDVSIAVASTEPIIGERVIYFEAACAIMGSGPSGVHNSTGVRSAGESWYFAEGTTRSNFQEYLCLMNPTGLDINATIQYLGEWGTVKTDTRLLAANSRTTLNVNTEVGPDQDVSMYVTADGPIVAERPMYFQYIPAGLEYQLWDGGHDTAGAKYAAYRWEFAEGTTRDGFQTYLCIANPNNLDVEVTIGYITSREDGTKETITETVTVPKNTRYTIRVNDVVEAGRDVSTVLTCGVPIVVERPMYFSSNGYVGGGTSLGFPGSL